MRKFITEEERMKYTEDQKNEARKALKDLKLKMTKGIISYDKYIQKKLPLKQVFKKTS